MQPPTGQAEQRRARTGMYPWSSSLAFLPTGQHRRAARPTFTEVMGAGSSSANGGRGSRSRSSSTAPSSSLNPPAQTPQAPTAPTATNPPSRRREDYDGDQFLATPPGLKQPSASSASSRYQVLTNTSLPDDDSNLALETLLNNDNDSSSSSPNDNIHQLRGMRARAAYQRQRQARRATPNEVVRLDKFGNSQAAAHGKREWGSQARGFKVRGPARGDDTAEEPQGELAAMHEEEAARTPPARTAPADDVVGVGTDVHLASVRGEALPPPPPPPAPAPTAEGPTSPPPLPPPPTAKTAAAAAARTSAIARRGTRPQRSARGVVISSPEHDAALSTATTTTTSSSSTIAKKVETPRWLIDERSPVPTPTKSPPAPAVAPEQQQQPLDDPEQQQQPLDAALIDRHRAIRRRARESYAQHHRSQQTQDSPSSPSHLEALEMAESAMFWYLEAQKLAAELSAVKESCRERDANVESTLKAAGQHDVWRTLGYSAAHCGAVVAHIARLWLNAAVPPQKRKPVKSSSVAAAPAAQVAPAKSSKAAAARLDLSGSETEDENPTAPTPRTLAARHLDLTNLMTPRAARRKAQGKSQNEAPTDSDSDNSMSDSDQQVSSTIKKELRRMEKAASSAASKEQAMRDKLDALRRQKEAAERRVMALAKDVSSMQTESEMWSEEERRRGGGTRTSPAKSDASSVARPILSPAPSPGPPTLALTGMRSDISSDSTPLSSSRSGLSAREKKDRIAEIQSRLAQLNHNQTTGGGSTTAGATSSSGGFSAMSSSTL